LSLLIILISPLKVNEKLKFKMMTEKGDSPLFQQAVANTLELGHNERSCQEVTPDSTLSLKYTPYAYMIASHLLKMGSVEQALPSPFGFDISNPYNSNYATKTHFHIFLFR